MKTRWCAITALVFLVCLFSVTSSSAQQNTADVVGTVSDTTGAVLPGASVTITNTDTNISKATQAGPTGDYTFTLLQVGTYSVKVEAMGFKTFTAANITLSSGDRARVDAKMEVGQATQTVEVSGVVAPALQTDSSNVGSLVTSTAVEDVPLNGRNIVHLVQLAPGVTEGNPGSIASGNAPDDRRQTSAYSVNGQVDSQNNNLIDGMDNNERIIGTIGVRPSVDAIQEVNISTNLYTAEVGRTSGGVVDIITKSGTNGLHGSAYEFFRNKVLNASPNWFTPTLKNPPFRQNQYGASLGGPIKNNKTFFFGDYESLQSAIGYAITSTVPTAFEEANPGNFTDIPAAVTGAPVVNISGLPRGCAGDPTPSPAVAGTCITQLGLDYFKMYPAPNIAPSNTAALGGCNPLSSSFSLCSAQPINDFGFNPTRTQKSQTFDTRIDQHFSDSNTFFARYSFNNVDTFTPPSFPNVTVGGITFNPGASGANNGYPGNSYERQQEIALSFVHVISSTAVLNLKAAYLRSKILSYNFNQNNAVNNKLGFPCTATSCISPTSGSAAATSAGLMGAAFSGPTGVLDTWNTLGDPGAVPIKEYDNTFQYMGSLTLNKGSQTIKIGLGVIRRRATIIQSLGGFGTSTFSGYYTGNPLADLLEGLTYSISRSNSLSAPAFRTWEPSAYVQDDWRIRHWLTLNLGIRHDMFTPYTDVHGAFSNFDPATGLIVSPSLPGIQNASRTNNLHTNYKDVAPRFGFAATLAHNTVIRGGFGLSYYPINYQGGFYMKNSPFNYSFSCQLNNNTQVNCPAAFANTSTASHQPSGFGTGLGGAWLPAGLPNPTFNIALATDPTTYGAQTMISVPFHFPDAYLDQSNLLLQKEWKGNVFTAGWVGDFGHHIYNEIQLNAYPNYIMQSQTTACGKGCTPLQLRGGSNVCNPANALTCWGPAASVRADGGYGSSAYDGLQTSFQRRLRDGLTVNFSYTWSHILALSGAGIGYGPCSAPTATVVNGTAYPCFFDVPGKTTLTGTTVSGEDDQYNSQKYGWGNSGQDVHDRFTWTANYNVPYGASLKGLEGALLSGWAFNTAGSWQTGRAFSVSLASAVRAPVGSYSSTNPDQIASGRLSNPTITNWFNQAAFIAQTPGTIGDEHPNQLFGPSLWRVDFSLFKNFSLTERLKLQFRTEVFNLLNHAEFNTPNAALGRAGVGSITSLNNSSIPRQIQLAARFTF